MLAGPRHVERLRGEEAHGRDRGQDEARTSQLRLDRPDMHAVVSVASAEPTTRNRDDDREHREGAQDESTTLGGPAQGRQEDPERQRGGQPGPPCLRVAARILWLAAQDRAGAAEADDLQHRVRRLLLWTR